MAIDGGIRVFPWDPAASEFAPFTPHYVPVSRGSGRFDLAEVRTLYLSETLTHAIAEKLQRYRGQSISSTELVEHGHRLAYTEVQFEGAFVNRMLDLCDPEVLARRKIGPDELQAHDRDTTQRIARALHEEGIPGIRWWSSLRGEWHAITVWMDQLDDEDEVTFTSPAQLSYWDQPQVGEALRALSINWEGPETRPASERERARRRTAYRRPEESREQVDNPDSGE